MASTNALVTESNLDERSGMRRLTIVFHHAGGGHRNAAEALRATLTQQVHPWEVSLLDIQELLDPLDLLRRSTGIRIQDTYNQILRRGWTRFTPQLLRILQGTIWLYHSRIVKALEAYWAEHPTDLVLSVIPHFNRELAESLGNTEKQAAVRHADNGSGGLSSALLD